MLGLVALALGPGFALGQDWPYFSGDPGAMRYSTLTSIDRANVRSLRPAWTWKVGEQAIGRGLTRKGASPSWFEATPLMIHDTLYLSTPLNRAVALDARTGRRLWVYDPAPYRWAPPTSPHTSGYVHRGVAAWTDGKSRRIFYASRWRLFALDAATGRPIPTFGHGGQASIAEPGSDSLQYLSTSPPVVFDDLVLAGSSFDDGVNVERGPRGQIVAFDARTGRVVWRFNLLPDAHEPGAETWEPGSLERMGQVNAWAPMSLDLARGLLFVPVASPANDWYGGRRKGDNLYSGSLVALDARTGRLVWYYQTVRHGLWDYDIAATPVLAQMVQRGKTVDVVIGLGKTGYVYVLDRVTGRPMWPVRERWAPPSDVPGEQAAATQPAPSWPRPFAKQGFGPDDVIDFTPELRARALDALQQYRTGPLFTPPSLTGTVVMPGWIGGAGWGAGAFDPETRTLYVKATNSPTCATLVPWWSHAVPSGRGCICPAAKASR
jgi:quinoprotein glucose dehydrogenase